MLFAGKPAHIREFLKIPVSAFTPPMPNPIELVVGDGSIILLDGIRHKQERGASCRRCTMTGSGATPD